MKTFKHLMEEVLEEGSYKYQGDDMTMKELKIACYAAQNILDRLEDGAMIQRWQISAIVKAAEELSSVYTSMSADEDEDDMDNEEWEDEYVGFEYPSMYGEEVELEEQKMTFQDAEKLKSKHLAAMQHHKKSGNSKGYAAHSMVVDKFEDAYDRHGTGVIPVGRILSASQKAFKDHPHSNMKEEADYKVTVDGLPDMYVKADSPSEVKNNLRKVVKNPEMIKGVERIAKASLQKMFRDKAAGKEVAEEAELDEAASYRDKGYANMLKADKKAEREVAKMRAQAAKRAEKEAAKKKPVQEENDLEEGYNDPIHRKYISDTVHDYVAKDDPRHDKIVDHLHKASNFGEKTVDSLSDHAGISYGAAKSITKGVASNLKANFGTPQKTQTQAQRVGAYLKQKHIGPKTK
jgi:hypothetical protein